MGFIKIMSLDWIIHIIFTVVQLAYATDSRRILHPNDNVGQLLKQFRSDNGRQTQSPKFTIHTELLVSTVSSKRAESPESPKLAKLALDVVEARNPAVTPDTIVRTRRDVKQGRSGKPIGQDVLHSLLINDIETADGANSFAILSIDPHTDEMHGFVEKTSVNSKRRKPYKISQSSNLFQGKTIAQEEDPSIAPLWRCDMEEHEGVDRSLTHHVHEGNNHNHGHKHYHHSHGHSHSHDNQNDSNSVIESITESLRGTKMNPLNKPRRLQSANYNFQVDLYIEIDNSFIANTGGTMNTTINYINVLVTAANVIFEKEIDTHLRVKYIVFSNLYDNTTQTSQVLDLMQSTYGRGDSWHSPGVDLHHALLGRLGAGRAYIGTLCRSDFGFGLTGGISGTFRELGMPVVWDMKAFMHEIGHSFGSGHSNDVNHFNPVIDMCGPSCPTTPGYRWSTIMSSCQGCPGGYENIMYTFGGTYDGSGDIFDSMNWPANPNMVGNYDATHKSVDPGREAQKMYLHVFSTSTSGCLALTDPISQSPTLQPTIPSIGSAVYDSTLGAPKCSTVGSFCDSGTLLNSRGAIDGTSEVPRPNTLDDCTDGNSGYYHTDESIDRIIVSTKEGGNLQVGAIINITAHVWAYSTSDDYADFYYASNATHPQWQLIETVNPTSTEATSVSTLLTLREGSLQAVRVVFRYIGSASHCPEGDYDDVDDLAFVVKSEMPITLEPTTKTTLMPTAMPTRIPTLMPTRVPTLMPTRVPTLMPTRVPTLMPTSIPTSMPTRKPTSMPTSIPTSMPTKKPTNKPISVASNGTTKIPTIKPTNKTTNKPTLPTTSKPTQKPASLFTL